MFIVFIKLGKERFIMSNESLMEVASGIPHENGGRKRQGKSDAFDREWHFLGMTHHFTCQPIYNIGKN